MRNLHDAAKRQARAVFRKSKFSGDPTPIREQDWNARPGPSRVDTQVLKNVPEDKGWIRKYAGGHRGHPDGESATPRTGTRGVGNGWNLKHS